jgi:hypothetical protein
MSRFRTSLLAVAAVVAVVVTVVAGQDQQQAGPLPAAEAARLVTVVVPLLEGGLPDARLGGRLACAAKVLGTTPADAVTASAVTTAYVWTACASLGTPVRSELSMPAVVHLGATATVEAPDDAGYTANVRRLFPQRLQDAAFNGYRDADLNTAKEQRVRELS